MATKSPDTDSGLRRLVARWAGLVLDAAQMRAKLAMLDVKELAQAWAVVAFVGGLTIAAAFTTFLMLNVLVLVWLRDYLLVTSACLAGFYAMVTWLLVRLTRTCIGQTPTPFADTLDELKKDAKALRPDHE